MYQGEAGGSGLDARGEVTEFIQTSLGSSIRGESAFSAIDHAVGEGWDGHNLTTIGPRNFEAAATKTCQILIEGDYGGVLKANVHYLPIKKDFSDFERILESLNDDLGQRIASKAYEDIALNPVYGYQYLVGELAEALRLQLQSKETSTPTDSGKYRWSLLRAIIYVFSVAPIITQLPNLLKLFAIKHLHFRQETK